MSRSSSRARLTSSLNSARMADMNETNHDAGQLSESIRRQALALGFDHCHFTAVGEAAHADFFEQWVELGRPGEMGYLTRNQEKRRRPALLAEDGIVYRTLVVLAVNYHQFELPPALRDDPSRGIIASYAWGGDYHEIVRPLLHQLDAFIAEASGRTTRGKCLVDTGPVLERDWAAHAGIGFIGKNCCTIRPVEGSWHFLATILIPETLVYDPPVPGNGASIRADDVAAGLPHDANLGEWRVGDRPATCGRCTRCLDACPTDAFVGPFHLNPQRCISYWTIEARGPIPVALRAQFGNRIFGCDICQEVCPWNGRLATRTPLLAGLRAQTERIAPPLLEGFEATNPYWLDDEAFRTRFRRSPIKRPKRAGMLRNVCVALGNWGDPEAVDALRLALGDAEPLARGHAAWALGQIAVRHPASAATRILRAAQHHDRDAWVRAEIGQALP